MLQQIPKNERTLFLLRFTNELIKNTPTNEIFELNNIIEEIELEKNKKETKLPIVIKEEIKPIPQKKEIINLKKSPPLSQNQELIKPLPRQFIKRTFHPLFNQNHTIRIPKQKVPLEFEYLNPTATNKQIDLGKLNVLVKDSVVKIIECNGPNENVMVKGQMGTKKTRIILNEQEINQIIKTFSETAKIPSHEGIFKVAVGRLIFSAIISNITNSKFIIQKIIDSPNFNRMIN